MSSSETEFLAATSARALGRLRSTLAKLPHDVAAAADPTAWVKQRPLAMVAGTFALSAWLTTRLSSSKRSRVADDCANSEAQGALKPTRDRVESPNQAGIWLAPIFSLAVRRLATRLAEINLEPTAEPATVAAANHTVDRQPPEFDPL